MLMSYSVRITVPRKMAGVCARQVSLDGAMQESLSTWKNNP